jgi:hypothetical protein
MSVANPWPEAIKEMRRLADMILKEDGDRDHMNTSNLKVPVTVAAAKVLRICADELEKRV